jgi:acyl carrier protein
VAIGKPISNTQIYLVDEQRNVVPAGLRGQIYVGGDGLARGYLNRPELTGESFVANWIDPAGSARLYRTGDVGRFRPSGELEYVGRVDHQVKIRGQRIELGEIEAVLATHPAIHQGVVAVIGQNSHQRLSAFLVGKLGERLPLAGEIRQHLRARLPESMIPGSYWQIEAVPLLSSGKVNRAAVASLPATALLDGEQVIEPRNEVEAKLAEIWCELLKTEKVGVEQNFFELGGHSLLVLQAAARIRRVFEVELPVRSVFESPTIAGLAQEIEKARSLGLTVKTPGLQKRPRASGGMSREALLAQLDGLSASELQSLLQRVLDRKQPA